MNSTKTWSHLLALAPILALWGCHGGGPGSATFTKEKKTETLEFGSALVSDHYVHAFVGCKVTCDMMMAGYPMMDKLEAACPGNWREVQLAFINPTAPAYSQGHDVPAGTYDKSKPMKFQPEVRTKDNTGRGYNYSTAKTYHATVAYSGQTATVTVDASDVDSSLKGSITAQVCPKK